MITYGHCYYCFWSTALRIHGSWKTVSLEMHMKEGHRKPQLGPCLWVILGVLGLCLRVILGALHLHFPGDLRSTGPAPPIGLWSTGPASPGDLGHLSLAEVPPLVCPTALTLNFNTSSWELMLLLGMRMKLFYQTPWKHSTESRCNFTLTVVKNNRIHTASTHTHDTNILVCNQDRIHNGIVYDTSYCLFQIWCVLNFWHISVVLAPS